DAAQGDVAARTGAAKPEHLQRFVTRGRVARGILDVVEADILRRAFAGFRRGVGRNADDHQRRTGQQNASKHQTLSHSCSMVARVKPEAGLLRKPVPSPDQVRAGLFGSIALRARTIPYVLAAIMAAGT